MSEIKLHFPADGDFPELSGEMHAERKPVLAYTKSLGWTQAIRRRVGKRAFEWVCSNYDGNTLFRDDEIVAWTELPKPEQLIEIKEFEDVKLLLEDMEKKEQAFHNAMNLLVVKAQPYLPIEVSAEYLPGDGACFAFDLGKVPMLLPMGITFDAIKRGEPITEDFMTRNSI